MPAKKATTPTKKAARKASSGAARSARKGGGRTRKQVRSTAKRVTRTTKRGTKKATRSTRRAARKPARARRRTTRPLDALALIKSDHQTVKDLFRRYKGLGDGAVKSKARTMERIVTELSVHAAVEEQVFYPGVKRRVPGSKRLVDHGLGEHQELKETLARLQRMSPDSPEFDTVMRKVIADVTDHVKEAVTPPSAAPTPPRRRDLVTSTRPSTTRSSTSIRSSTLPVATRTWCRWTGSTPTSPR